MATTQSTSTIITTESVCKGHPDKLSDQISDAILDEILRQDPYGRVAVETMLTKDLVVLAGEITTTATVPFEEVARRVIAENGYTQPEWGFSDQANIITRLQQQSPEIAQGVNTGGAGDQGFNVGFATNETTELIPLPQSIARALTQKIDVCRETRGLDFLRPDGKAQVSVNYVNGKPHDINQVTVAVAHDEAISSQSVRDRVIEKIIKPVLENAGLPYDKAGYIVNGTGAWHIPGPASDTGLTGRKIVVDAYGSAAKVGGGAFSGKDPSKVDRSGAYAARYYARQIVQNGLADSASVYIAWAIGHPKPLAIHIEANNCKTSEQKLIRLCHEWLDPSVQNIIDALHLRQPIYQSTAALGHFGRPDLPWEC